MKSLLRVAVAAAYCLPQMDSTAVVAELLVVEIKMRVGQTRVGSVIADRTEIGSERADRRLTVVVRAARMMSAVSTLGQTMADQRLIVVVRAGQT